MPAPLLAFADAPTARVTLRILFTGFQTGTLALVADAVMFAVAALYLLGIRRLARRGRRWSPWSTVSFIGGLVILWVAVGSGLAAYDSTNVTMHVVQHVMMMMVAPPLIALGRPVTVASQAASRAGQVRIVRVVNSALVAGLTFPVVAWFLYYGTMYGYFMTSLYPYSITHPLFHDLSHLWFVAVGYLYWQPLVGLDPARWRWSYPVRIGSLFLGMPFEAFLGVGISQLPHPLGPTTSLAATHAAGDTLWILSMMATGLCLGIVVVQWFHQLDRETARADRRADAVVADSRARAEALGIDLPPGATVPWWRLDELEAERARRERTQVKPGADGRPS